MKKLYILPLALLMVFVSSCKKDYLESPIYDKIDPSGVFSNEETIAKALYGIYHAMSNSSNEAWTWSPLSHFNNNPALDCQAGGWDMSWSTHEWNSSFSGLNSIWRACYVGIDRANRFLQNIDNADPNVFVNLDPEMLKAEARAIRAWLYYELAVSFSGKDSEGNYLAVPLLMEGETYSTTPNKARNTKEEVYDFIISEFKAVSNILDWKPYKDAYIGTKSQYGRPTKGFCKAFEAQAQMDLGNYSVAITLWEEILNCGEYSLEPEFKNIHQIMYNWGPESIWEVAYPAVSDGAKYGDVTGTRHWTKIKTGGDLVSGTGGWGSLFISDEWVALFDDATKDGKYDTPTQYAKNSDGDWIIETPGDICYDERLLGSIVPRNGWNTYTMQHVNDGFQTDNLPRNAMVKYWKEPIDYNSPYNQYSPQPIIIMRLGVAKLLYAECLFRTGNENGAWDQLQDLIDRAYSQNPSEAYQAKTYYTTLLNSKNAEMKAAYTPISFAVLWEGRKEALNEYFVWNYMRRCGYAAVDAYLRSEYSAPKLNGTPNLYADPNKHYEEYRLSFPIPLNEMTRNSLMTQNEKY